MLKGHFYYLTDQYFIDFPDPFLMQNKEMAEGQLHDRPCYYAFQEADSSIFWMIPFSSQVNKYRSYYRKKIEKYGRCDTLVFGDVLGHEKVFLIQNMCPVTEVYVKNEYIDYKIKASVRINGALEKEIGIKAKKVLALQRKGAKLVFPDVLAIEKELLKN